MNRRSFFKTGGAIAAAATTPAMAGVLLRGPGNSTGSAIRAFPKDFVWGSATASYQVEGAVNEDGRGPSIWDTYSHIPGNIVGNNTGDRADNHYHRHKEDVALMKAIGLKGYRFSIAWSRIFPNASGTPNRRGLDFYDRLLDELHASGIEPYCTLFHWDLPQYLQDKGGWAVRDTSKAFADYAGFVAGKLSDRIRNWLTMNEFASFIDSGYGSHPTKAPGVKLARAELAQARHYAVLAHGMAVRSIRSAARQPVRIGLAENIAGMMPAIETDEHIHAAEKAIRDANAQYATVIFEGKYPESYLSSLGGDAPKFTAEELDIISTPLDFVGINIYTTNQVMAADNAKGYVVLQRPASFPRMVSSWLYVAPEAMYWTPKLVAKIWRARDIYITENGCSCDDVLRDGEVLDTDRIMFLRQYLTQLQRAVSDGVPVRGYFLWSLLDNFEWSYGYSQRFGITYVDFETQQRTPKLSSKFYSSVIRRNGVV